MGTSKTAVFNNQQNQTANIMKALGHPARVAIVQQLAKNGVCFSEEIVKESPLSQPTVWQHLHILDKAGLIQRNVTDNLLAYGLKPEKFLELEDFYKGIL